MIKTPLSIALGGAFWTPGCAVMVSQNNIHQLIKSLFANGTQGIYLNAQDALSVSDLSSIKDLSGNNNHALQANSTSRASLITDPSGYKSLKFDGIDDGYVTQSIDFSGTDKVTVIAAVRKLSDANRAVLIEFGAAVGAVNGSFGIEAPRLNKPNTYSFGVQGSVQPGTISESSPTFASPNSALLAAKGDLLVNVTAKLSVNGVAQTVGASAFGANTKYGNYPIYIGRRAGTSLPFSGQIYALLVIGKLLDDATTAKIEKEFAKYIGVTL
ncbi:hypothetical protein HLH10_04875 [Acinetobacter sp. ANC 4277]|uniref:hypothetical protein n=1 Tax=Acinetobacter terrae TaxID=2731247 RepID=UPI00148FC4DB|nr:hypothetical protein [Acinetobacter terrae]NNG75667.1 hypothetical protein [Acinetobacter terrae]